MDFIQVSTRETKRGVEEVYPDFVVGRSQDLMVRGKGFYAVWDEKANLWSTDEYEVQRLVDEELRAHAKEKGLEQISSMRSFKNQNWTQFRRFMSLISDNAHQLDENLTFANTEVKKKDYVSRRLPYSLTPGDISAWDELVGTLYAPEERAKIEWAIGAVISGDSKSIQKFLVFYGPAGTGKSTVLNIIQQLFSGYTTSFEAKALGSNNGTFATEIFGNNPLVAIQHDGDLSKIEDNTRLNSIISHEEMTMNAKYKSSWTARINALLMMGTNQPVKISDAKSGIIRRLIDVNPTGVKLAPNHYHTLMAKISFELGAIAHHCLQVYREMGKNYYNSYRPLEMMFQTDIFFNYIEAHYDVFKAQDGATLKQAYSLYKEWCDETGIDPRYRLPQYKFREELRNYFGEFLERHTIAGTVHRSYYQGFTADLFKAPVDQRGAIFSLVLEETTSLLDLELAEAAAQPAKEDGTPQKRWSEVKTSLAEIDTSELHYLRVPHNHIVIDFDLKGEDGEKSLEKNLEAASRWPATYAELSKSGSGVHLHYLYDGDPDTLASSYDDGIEVKVFVGNLSLRRRLSRCNNVPIASINSGLPLKEKKVLDTQTIQSEKGLRALIGRNLRKEIHPGTKPSIDFIKKILDEAYLSGMKYDLTNMRGDLIAFANNSTNQPMVCLKTVQQMKFKSADDIPFEPPYVPVKNDTRVFFDVEVYPNLFVVCWMYEDSDNIVAMVNPSPQEIEALFKLKLIGFNNRRYDNHILYAAYLGYDNEALYKLSQKIIDGVQSAMFGEAYHLSYTDIFDFSAKKQSLKKFQVELGLAHVELDIPWDKPVPKELWAKVVEYCKNDVRTTKETFKARMQDFVARQILAELSGLTVNHTTQNHTARIVFGEDRNPQREFEYTDLSKEFPGYVYDKGKSTYRGEDVGEGGYVYAEPGMYKDVAELDVASMHPSSIIWLNMFGMYTPRFKDLLDARLAIKHEDYDSAGEMLGGKLKPYLEDKANAKDLSYALKIVINIVYGLTSAKFDNAFRDTRNVDNIAAKRGALFMIDLKNFVQERGFTVAHIKTDSIKIPGANLEIIEEVKRFGEKYGYTFEYKPEENFYDKFCLVNDAVYVAKNGEKWTTIGAQFAHPYVFKKLFEPENTLVFDDFCETKQVSQGAIYMDFKHTKTPDDWESMHFVGRLGRFVPVKEGNGGATLWRVKDGKSYAIAGTKGYLWVEAEVAKTLPEDAIDMTYFDRLADEAMKTIDKFGNFEDFAYE